MMTIPDAATNARELLEGITPGPWFAEHDPKHHPEDPERWVDSHANVFGGPVRVVDVAQGSNDAEFIAAAPALVASLLAALETVETERVCGLDVHQWVKIAEQRREWLSEARATIAAVEQALSNHPECDKYSPDDVVSCGWKRAVVDVRAALGGV